MYEYKVTSQRICSFIYSIAFTYPFTSETQAYGPRIF